MFRQTYMIGEDMKRIVRDAERAKRVSIFSWRLGLRVCCDELTPRAHAA
jgi:hypothetical protein